MAALAFQARQTHWVAQYWRTSSDLSDHCGSLDSGTASWGLEQCLVRMALPVGKIESYHLPGSRCMMPDFVGTADVLVVVLVLSEDQAALFGKR